MLAVAPVVLGIDEDGDDEAQQPESRVDALADDVVVRVAADVVPGDARDRPEPVSHERARGCEQDPVEAPDDRRGCDCLFAPASEAARPGIDGLNHSSSAPRPGLDAS